MGDEWTCDVCGETVEESEMYHVGSYVGHSECLQSAVEEYIEKKEKKNKMDDWTRTEHGDKILWVLLEDDAQILAEQKLGRKLTEDELYQVTKGIEYGLGDWRIVMETAIEESVKRD